LYGTDPTCLFARDAFGSLWETKKENQELCEALREYDQQDTI